KMHWLGLINSICSRIYDYLRKLHYKGRIFYSLFVLLSHFLSSFVRLFLSPFSSLVFSSQCMYSLLFSRLWIVRDESFCVFHYYLCVIGLCVLHLGWLCTFSLFCVCFS